MSSVLRVREASLTELVSTAQSARRDDNPAMNELIRRFDGKAKHLARGICRYASNHDDVANAARFAVLRAARRHTPGRVGFTSYAVQFMSGAARRTSIQLAPREVSVANQTIADLADRQEHVADQARFEHGTPLAGAFDRLTLKQRQLLVERFVEDLLPSEIARRHGVSTSAVSQRLKTVLKTLRELLTKDSEEGVKT